MVGNTVRLGRLWGIEVRLHYSWFIVFVLVTWSLAIFYFPQVHRGWTGATYWGMGIVTSLGVMAPDNLMQFLHLREELAA